MKTFGKKYADEFQDMDIEKLREQATFSEIFQSIEEVNGDDIDREEIELPPVRKRAPKARYALFDRLVRTMLICHRTQICKC